MSRKRYQLIATCFDRKGKVLGAGVNEYNRSHPLMKHFSLQAGESEEKIYKHAELSAVLSCGNKDIHSILVQRYQANGDPANAMPCRTCQEMLKSFGVKVVKYTTEDGLKEYQVA
jgi:deoxycytidylate deaminase